MQQRRRQAHDATRRARPRRRNEKYSLTPTPEGVSSNYRRLFVSFRAPSWANARAPTGLEDWSEERARRYREIALAPGGGEKKEEN